MFGKVKPTLPTSSFLKKALFRQGTILDFELSAEGFVMARGDFLCEMGSVLERCPPSWQHLRDTDTNTNAR